MFYNDETWNSYILPKSDTKNVWMMWHTPWLLLTSAIFQWKSENFAILRNTCIDCILIKNCYFNFSWVFKDCFNKKVTILMMLAKMAAPGFLKITVFQNKGYNVIINVHHVISKILSLDSNYIGDMVMWPKFDDTNITMGF